MGNSLEWQDARTTPEDSGKYVVKTLTPMGNSNTFECYFHKNEKDDTKSKWSCSNQKVVYWLRDQDDFGY